MPADFVRDIKKEMPRSLDDIERWPIEHTLVLLGAILGLILAPLVFIYEGADALLNSGKLFLLAKALFHFLTTVVFSLGLALTLYYMRRRMKNSAYIFGFISSFLLLVLGGTAGAVSGLIGIIGVLFYLLRMEAIL